MGIMQALVTGGTGFVGAHVARELARQGHSVRVLHRASSRRDALAGVTYESALGDILDLDSLRRACAGCDWVFHVAAVSAYWRTDSATMLDANVRGTQLVLQAAREAGVKRVVFTSSAAAVGIRDDGTPADEGLAFNQPPGRFLYGYSKALAERVVGEAVAAGLDVVTVNPVVILGPGDINQIAGDFVIQIKKLGWQVPVPPGGVAVTDVRDVARWQIAAAERGATGERYILGSENYPHHYWFALVADVIGAVRPTLPIPPAIIPVIAEMIGAARALGLKPPIDADQIRLSGRKLYFDHNKAWSTLGEPRIPMRQSIQDTYDWYRATGVL